MTGIQARPRRTGIAPSAARRAVDILLSAAGLVLLSPVLAGLALAVRLSSPGPAIFRQQRVGQGGVPFTMYKFRSMRVGEAGPLVTTGEDDRVTPLGRFLRRTSLDEVPQLVNVLRGDMTLVGPRPEAIALAARYPAELQGVFQYRPGLTGPVQLHMREVEGGGEEDVEARYLRDDVPRRVALDLEFQSEASLVQTLRLLAATAAYILSGSG